ncbi:hypothetical protein P0092_02505 [Ruminiclostridium papyrosolvens DSM 2782]|nr:hypothetical protein [Ruminiclostridium papyrosolvens]WES34871.1 hypothetical protein P0092_02505 [Ruminiclostridium papyrosolvens DSM 2782]
MYIHSHTAAEVIMNMADVTGTNGLNTWINTPDDNKIEYLSFYL